MGKLKIVLHLSMGSLLNPSVEFPLIGQCMIAQDSAGSGQDARGGIQDRTQQAQLTSTEDNGIQNSLASGTYRGQGNQTEI